MFLFASWLPSCLFHVACFHCDDHALALIVGLPEEFEDSFVPEIASMSGDEFNWLWTALRLGILMQIHFLSNVFASVSGWEISDLMSDRLISNEGKLL